MEAGAGVCGGCVCVRRESREGEERGKKTGDWLRRKADGSRLRLFSLPYEPQPMRRGEQQ